MENNRSEVNDDACNRETEEQNTANMETEEQNTTPRRRKRVRLNKHRGKESLRTEHCSRLSRLLSVLIQQRNWKEASGVLSTLLKGTARETFPEESRAKYLAAMEFLKKTENDDIKTTHIKRIYEVWIRKNGAMKKSPVKDKFSASFERILFCLTHGEVNVAIEATTSLMETEYGDDPVLNMMVGMLFYELWYTCIPEEMKLKASDTFVTPMVSEFSGLGSYNPVESTCCNSYDDQNTESSASSVGDNKDQPVESISGMQKKLSHQRLQPQQIYTNNSSEISGKEEANRSENLMGISIFEARGLSASLLPIRIPKSNESLGDPVEKYMKMLNDNYSKAVKHLRVALHSDPPLLASLLPLIQLLLLGDQVEVAAKEVENICLISNALLPLRIKSILMECFDAQNTTMLSTCYEDILNKDPTCIQSLTKLITMHKNGDYGLLQVLDMIALHLDATQGTLNVWEEFSSCFLNLFCSEEDQHSVCGEGVGKTRMDTSMVRFIHGKEAKKRWELRCRWWGKKYFGKNGCMVDVEKGEWGLLKWKGACAAHLYGPECEYVGKVLDWFEKMGKKEERVVVERHIKCSVRVLEQLKSDEIVLDDSSCFSS